MLTKGNNANEIINYNEWAATKSRNDQITNSNQQFGKEEKIKK